jgi:hypothetical protein
VNCGRIVNQARVYIQKEDRFQKKQYLTESRKAGKDGEGKPCERHLISPAFL